MKLTNGVMTHMFFHELDGQLDPLMISGVMDIIGEEVAKLSKEDRAALDQTYQENDLSELYFLLWVLLHDSIIMRAVKSIAETNPEFSHMAKLDMDDPLFNWVAWRNFADRLNDVHPLLTILKNERMRGTEETEWSESVLTRWMRSCANDFENE